MKFEEALKAIREGKRVRLPCECYFVLDECKDNDNIIDANGNKMKFGSESLLSEDWEVVE